MKKHVLVMGLILMAFLFHSCEKEIAQTNAGQETTTEGYYVQDGVLCFNTEQDFKDFRNKVLHMSYEEFHNWEQSISFNSFRTEYYNILDKIDSCQTTEELNSTIKNNSDLIYLDEDVVEPVVFQEKYQDIANRYGLFVVAGVLYKVNTEALLQFENACTDDLEEMRSITSSEENAIKICSFSKGLKLKSATYCGLDEEDTSEATNKRRCYARIYVEGKSDVIATTSTKEYYYTTECFTRAEKKVLGVWCGYNDTEHFLSDLEIVIEAPKSDCSTGCIEFVEYTISKSYDSSEECRVKTWINDSLIGVPVLEELPSPELKRVKGTFWTRGSAPETAVIKCGY